MSAKFEAVLNEKVTHTAEIFMVQVMLVLEVELSKILFATRGMMPLSSSIHVTHGP